MYDYSFSVCGDHVVQFNDTMRDRVSMVKSIFVSVSDKQHPIIAKVRNLKIIRKALLVHTL